MGFIIQEGYTRDVGQVGATERFDFWRDVITQEYVHLDCADRTGRARQNFGGTIRGGVGVGRVRFSEVHSDPQVAIRNRAQIARAAEDDFLISFQITEQCIIRQAGREALLTPGSFALYDSTRQYSLTFDKPFHQFVLQMPRDVLSRHLLEPERYVATAISAREGLGNVLQQFTFSLARELCGTDRGPGELLSENLVNLIALSLSSTVMHRSLTDSDSVREALVQRIIQFIDNNLCDCRLNASRIAESQGISLRYLHKLMQGRPETVHEMIVNRRLERARDLLAASAGERRSSVEAIAYSVGFASPSHFSRLFKARFGLCPSELSRA